MTKTQYTDQNILEFDPDYHIQSSEKKYKSPTAD